MYSVLRLGGLLRFVTLGKSLAWILCFICKRLWMASVGLLGTHLRFLLEDSFFVLGFSYCTVCRGFFICSAVFDMADRASSSSSPAIIGTFIVYVVVILLVVFDV